MKIYFAGSIRGGRDDRDLYMEIIRHLQTYGEVLTEHIGHKTLSEQGESVSDVFIYNRDMSWLRQADVIVAEVTQVSMGVGYEIAAAEYEHKPVLCLYRPQPDKRLSAMIRGNTHLQTADYTTFEEAKSLIQSFMENAAKS